MNLLHVTDGPPSLAGCVIEKDEDGVGAWGDLLLHGFHRLLDSELDGLH